MSKDNFKWTDDLVKHAIKVIGAAYNNPDLYNNGKWEGIGKEIDKFKASHSSDIVDEKEAWGSTAGVYSRISYEKDWEIKCLVNDGRNYWLQQDGLYKSEAFGKRLNGDWLLSNGWDIFQVLRKSDGVVFSVGDMCEDDLNGHHDLKIKEFELNEKWAGGLAAIFGEHSGCIIKHLSKAQPIPQRTKLFTTEDEVDVFEGDKYWYLTSVSWELFKCTYASNGEGWPKGWKYFSAEEKGKEYVAQNKPLNLSMKEIASCVTNYVQKGKPFGPNLTPDKSAAVIDFEKLDVLIKSKP